MKILYHHPHPIMKTALSGSGVRPFQMLKAFHSLGHEILEVTGSSKERHKIFHEALKDGSLQSCNVCYAENSTEPLGLTDSHHLPLRINLEPSLFSALRDANIPVGIFYRDFHWLFPLYNGMASPFKRRVAKLFYQIELRIYRRYASIIFLPTLEMQKHLPQLASCKAIALPPGCQAIPSERVIRVTNGRVRAIYVGGIVPPYELAPMADFINRCKVAELTLICRERELAISSLPNQFKEKERLNIVQASGEKLANLYAQADVFLWLRGDCEYLDYAFPVKISEAISFGLPILTMGDNPISKFVRENGIGWVVSSVDEAIEVFSKIVNRELDLEALAKRVVETARRNTWNERATKVISDLMGQKG